MVEFLPDVIKLRPHSHLLSTGFTACVAFLTPVFLVLYFLTIPDGPWLAVLVAQLVATVIVGAAGSRYFGAAIWLDSTGISERGFFRNKRHFATTDIGSIVMASTFRSSEPDGVPQLFVCDREGKQLVRMRGEFWSRTNMQIVVDALDVPFFPVEETRSTREINEEFPGVGYWFERRPVLAALMFSASIAVLGILTFVILTLAGVRIGA